MSMKKCCLFTQKVVTARSSLRPGGRGPDTWSLLIALALFVPVAWVHELLHALAAVTYGHMRPQDLRLRVLWKMGALSRHIKVPIPVQAARVVGLASLVVLGPPALRLVLMYPRPATAMLGGMAILGCITDIVMAGKLRRFDGGLLVADHPIEPRLDIYAPEDSTTACAKGEPHISSEPG